MIFGRDNSQFHVKHIGCLIFDLRRKVKSLAIFERKVTVKEKQFQELKQLTCRHVSTCSLETAMYIPDILRARVTWVSVLKMPFFPIPEVELSVGDTASTDWLFPLFGLAIWTVSDCWAPLLPA